MLRRTQASRASARRSSLLRTFVARSRCSQLSVSVRRGLDVRSSMRTQLLARSIGLNESQRDARLYGPRNWNVGTAAIGRPRLRFRLEVAPPLCGARRNHLKEPKLPPIAPALSRSIACLCPMVVGCRTLARNTRHEGATQGLGVKLLFSNFYLSQPSAVADQRG